MAREQIPVTPAVITWARERAGFSIIEASEDFRKIEAWEAGESFPTYPQLEQLAKKFKLPIAVFFFPAPPVIFKGRKERRPVHHCESGGF